jgi:hypothetical protein
LRVRGSRNKTWRMWAARREWKRKEGRAGGKEKDVLPCVCAPREGANDSRPDCVTLLRVTHLTCAPSPVCLDCDSVQHQQHHPTSAILDRHHHAKMSFDGLTVAKLKEACKARGLQVSGTKPVLKARLEQHETGAGSVASPTPSATPTLRVSQQYLSLDRTPS